jgi:hypothetical protein
MIAAFLCINSCQHDWQTIFVKQLFKVTFQNISQSKHATLQKLESQNNNESTETVQQQEH